MDEQDWAKVQEVLTWIQDHGMPVITALIVILVAWIAAGLVRRAMIKAFEKSRFDTTLAKFFSNLARYAILLAAGLGVLGVFGVETTSFAAVIGAAGLAVGLAFQGTLANFAAGIMLLIFRPFKVDDVIHVGGTTGSVVEIELFTTELMTPDRVKIIMPNSAIFGAEIKNFSAHELRRVDVDVGCDYGADIDATREVLVKSITGIEGGVEDPAPEAYLTGLGGSSVDWQVRVFAKPADYWAVRQRVIRAVKMGLDEAGIGIPFPQMDVHLDRADAAE